MFCRKCGSKIPDDSLFCTKCGEKTGTPQRSEQKKAPNAPSFPKNKERLSEMGQDHISISPPTSSSIPEEPHTFKECFLSLFKFSGRISKKHLIKNLFIALPVFIILFFIGSVFAVIIDSIMGRSILEPRPIIIDLSVLLFSAIPMLSILVRRMRDAGIPIYFLPICLGAMCFFEVANILYSTSMSEVGSFICNIASYVIFFILLFFSVLPSKHE